MSVKYPNYVNLTSSSEEQPNKRTPSPPLRKKSLLPPQALSKSISSKSTHYTSSSSPKPQELPPPQISPNDPYAQTMDNWPPGLSNPSLPPRVSRPPPDHRKARRWLAEVAAYNPTVKANYVAAVNALCAVDFPLLAQFATHKDSRISDLMDLLRLEGPVAETPKAGKCFRLEGPAAKTLDLAHARMRKLEENAAPRWLPISDAVVPIVEPLSAENIIGPSTEVPSLYKIVLEKEELDTTPEHTAAS
nr:hypothetical protein [Tanacetum cinerariifolium]